MHEINILYNCYTFIAYENKNTKFYGLKNNYPLVAFIRCASFIPARGMALFPFILVKYPQDLTNARLIRHEYIHIWQQLELFIIPFYILYLLNYLLNRLKGQNHDQAYFNICFEKEAFLNDHNEKYLQERRLWSFMRYIKKKSSF